MSETKNKKVSIKDVARHSGVGIGTVSRVINNSDRIRPETRQKVLNSIKELGYIPNRLAQSMRSHVSKDIAFFVDISNLTFSRIATGVYQYLESHGYTLTLCHIGKNRETAFNKVKTFLSGRRFDGIILSLPNEEDETLNGYLKKQDIPIVTMDRDIPGLATGVVTDYQGSVRKAVDYLVSLGHRGIAMLNGLPIIRPSKLINRSFREALERNGLPTDDSCLFTGEYTRDFGAQTMLNLLPRIRSGEVTAIICMHDEIFHGLLQVMKDCQLRCPEDISVITLEDYEMTQLLTPPFTVIRRQLFDMGEKVAQTLINYIQNPELYGQLDPHSLPTELIIRESCAPVPSR
jgi:LacI family transcriptional regulator